mgnify:CR=1 FL=1
MTESKQHKGLQAVKELEVNSLRLSEVVVSLNDLKVHLTNLASVVESAEKISAKSQRETENLGKAIQDIEGKLTNELKVKLAEGTAEQSSRLKDANEKLIELDSKNIAATSDLKTLISNIEGVGHQVHKNLKSLGRVEYEQKQIFREIQTDLGEIKGEQKIIKFGMVLIMAVSLIFFLWS